MTVEELIEQLQRVKNKKRCVKVAINPYGYLKYEAICDVRIANKNEKEKIINQQNLRFLLIMVMLSLKEVEEMNKKDILAEQYKQKYLKEGKEFLRLTEYIENLKHFHTVYSAANDDGEMTEELMMWEQLIQWLEELKHKRESEYPYIVDFADVNNDEE